MPLAIYDRAWTEAQQFIEHLVKDKSQVDAAPIRMELDRAVESGDLNQLLRLCIGQRLLPLFIKLEREALDRQDRGEQP